MRSKYVSFTKVSAILGVTVIAWVSVGFWSLFSQVFATELFNYSGKVYTEKDLPVADQQSLFEIEKDKNRSIEAIVEKVLLDMYFDDIARKKKITSESAREAEFKVKDPFDKDLKKFFDDNKARIPPGYKFEQIKDQLKSAFVNEQQFEKRKTLIEKLKKSGGYKFLLSELVAPVFKIDVSGFPTKGKAGGAKVQLIEFADYKCGHCSAAASSINKLISKYSYKVEFVFIHFLLNRAGVSKRIAVGSYCALDQKKFWEYHSLAFEKQAELNNESPLKFAKELKLDEDRFKKCLDLKEAEDFVERGRAEGERVGISGTPTFFINGKKHFGGYSYDELNKAIEDALK